MSGGRAPPALHRDSRSSAPSSAPALSLRVSWAQSSKSEREGTADRTGLNDIQSIGEVTSQAATDDAATIEPVVHIKAPRPVVQTQARPKISLCISRIDLPCRCWHKGSEALADVAQGGAQRRSRSSHGRPIFE